MQQKQLRLGDILLQANVVTLEQINQATKVSQQNNIRLGEAVVKMGFATEEAIAIAVSKLLGVPYASRENKILSPEKGQNLEKIVEERFARDNLLLPLFLEDQMLAAAMAEPDNVMVLDNLRLMTGYEVQPFIATRAQILKTIDEFYGSSGSLIDKVMEAREGGEEGGDGDASGVDVTSDGRVNLDKMVAEAKGAQVVSVVNAILKQAISEKASDIHIERYDERVVLRFRIHGVLYERTPPSKEAFAAVISRIKILSKLDIAERRLPQDGAMSLQVQNRVIDMRVSICPTVFGEKVVMRVLDKGAVNLSIDSRGFDPKQKEDFMKAAEAPHGLIFLTGPTGSGKTTTLYTILNTIKSPDINIMTIEDPVEFKLEGINQVQTKAAINLTFASALRSFLRQDPDVILVGEVRDQETAKICLQAALTGHLVLSTLHTNSALESVARLTDMGIEPFLLASSLRLVAAQRLVRTLCPSCRESYKPEAELAELASRESMFNPPPDPGQFVFYRAKGCSKCHNTGYTGRCALYEVYYITKNLRDSIYKHSNDLNEIIYTGAREGFWNLRASGWRKVIEGITSAEEVMSVTVSE
ncbi:MAG: Flp pilus assembly complex ATPase component TadA [Elusimicrobia bacterium]|nr:Flp pilus assembly complex ATPase component TadA [Elusimicrobiota bacterium]